MPLYRFHLESQAKVFADATYESPAKLAEAGKRDGFISATITTGELQTNSLRRRASPYLSSTSS